MVRVPRSSSTAMVTLAVGLREELFKVGTWIRCPFSQLHPLWAGEWAPGLAPAPETEPWGRSWGSREPGPLCLKGLMMNPCLDTYPGPASG